MQKKKPMPIHIARQIAAEAKTDPRTVQRVHLGLPTRGMVRERIVIAMKAAGMLVILALCGCQMAGGGEVPKQPSGKSVGSRGYEVAPDAGLVVRLAGLDVEPDTQVQPVQPDAMLPDASPALIPDTRIAVPPPPDAQIQAPPPDTSPALTPDTLLLQPDTLPVVQDTAPVLPTPDAQLFFGGVTADYRNDAGWALRNSRGALDGSCYTNACPTVSEPLCSSPTDSRAAMHLCLMPSDLWRCLPDPTEQNPFVCSY